MIFNYVILKVQGSSPICDGYSSLTVQLPLKSEKYCHQKCPDVPDLDHISKHGCKVYRHVYKTKFCVASNVELSGILRYCLGILSNLLVLSESANISKFRGIKR